MRKMERESSEQSDSCLAAASLGFLVPYARLNLANVRCAHHEHTES